MSTPPIRLAIVYPGDAEVRRAATSANNRFAALFAAFAARGVAAEPAVYNLAQIEALREQLLRCDGALVWVNPIEAGHSREPLDAMLRAVAQAGVFVSTHPDVVMRLGTKDVLVDTRELGWGSDVHRLGSLAQLRTELRARLDAGAARVLKQWRGHSGIGVWRVQRSPATIATGAGSEVDRVRACQAQRGSVETEMSFDAFVELMAPYFADGGHMIDQAWQPRLTEGMVRCYLVRERVVGFGLQAINALHPAPEGAASGDAPAPGPRLYHPPDLAHVQALRRRLEGEWVPALKRTLGLGADDLPLLWDCDFLLGEPGADGEERYVLCEINVSSVAPFPDSAIAPLVEATIARLAAAAPARSPGKPQP